jgi:hypothetical protein
MKAKNTSNIKRDIIALTDTFFSTSYQDPYATHICEDPSEISIDYLSLLRSRRWALLFHLASTLKMRSLDGYLTKEGKRNETISDLPHGQITDQQLDDFLQTKGISHEDVACFKEQLEYFQYRNFTSNDVILNACCYLHDTLPYHKKDCFEFTEAHEHNKPYLSPADECELLVHLLRFFICIRRKKIYSFAEAPFTWCDSNMNEKAITKALSSAGVNPSRVRTFLADLMEINRITTIQEGGGEKAPLLIVP